MIFKNILIFLFCSLFLFCSCSQKNVRAGAAMPIDTVQVAYASGFSLIHYADYTEAVVYNPWQKGEIQARYYLTSDSLIQTPNDGIRVLVPVLQMATSSCTHIGFLAALNELTSVKGIFLPDLIYNPTIREACSAGKIANLGDPLQINVEKVLALRPQVVMISGYGQNDVSYDRLLQMGVSVIYNNEWMEKTPLARAEWLKFVAAFYNKEQLADSLFHEVETAYKQLTHLPQQVKTRKTLMTGSNFRGTWYVPSGQTYMGRFFADAGANYFYASDSTAGSIPLNIETVLYNFGTADVWVGSNANTLHELREIDQTHTLFKAYQNKQVFNFYGRIAAGGANDFWEMGVVQPEKVLSDLIFVLYPELLPNYVPFFIKQLP